MSTRPDATEQAMLAADFMRRRLDWMPAPTPDNQRGRLDVARELAAIRIAAGEVETLLGAELLEEAAAQGLEPEMRGRLDALRVHAANAWESEKEVRR